MSSRALRNCNPGNIRRSRGRYKGEVSGGRDPHFRQFESMEWGYRAMFHLLDAYRRRHGVDTLRGVIERWAPPVENDTRGYLAFVVRRSGTAPDEVLDTRCRDAMVPVVAAMSRMECGEEPDAEQIERGWSLFIADAAQLSEQRAERPRGDGADRA